MRHPLREKKLNKQIEPYLITIVCNAWTEAFCEEENSKQGKTKHVDIQLFVPTHAHSSLKCIYLDLCDVVSVYASNRGLDAHSRSQRISVPLSTSKYIQCFSCMRLCIEMVPMIIKQTDWENCLKRRYTGTHGNMQGTTMDTQRSSLPEGADVPNCAPRPDVPGPLFSSMDSDPRVISVFGSGVLVSAGAHSTRFRKICREVCRNQI